MEMHWKAGNGRVQRESCMTTASDGRELTAKEENDGKVRDNPARRIEVRVKQTRYHLLRRDMPLR